LGKLIALLLALVLGGGVALAPPLCRKIFILLYLAWDKDYRASRSENPHCIFISTDSATFFPINDAKATPPQNKPAKQSTHTPAHMSPAHTRVAICHLIIF